MNYLKVQRSKSFISALFFILLFSTNIEVLADIPRLINYQGVLTDKQGIPVAGGSYVITFSLYDSPFEGSPFWVEVLPIITINGYFNVMLGAQTEIESFPPGGAWLGIKVGSDDEMALRTNLASVPYAFLVADSSVGTQQIKDKSITAEKIIPTIISSINGLSNNGGNIDIMSGDNITIAVDSVNNTLTISSNASGGGGTGGFLNADSFQVINSESAIIVVIGKNSEEAGSADFFNRFGQSTVLITTLLTSPASGALGIFEDDEFAAGIFGKDGGGGLFQLVNASGSLTLNLDGEDLGGGSVSVLNQNGETTVFLDGAFGDIAATGVKSFIAPHPTNASKDIFYAAIEGPEAGMYTRGTGRLTDGEAEVFLPEHFMLLASSGSLTVTVTPLSATSFGLAIVDKSTYSFVVKELYDGLGNYEFDYLVQAVRKGYEDFEVVRPKRREISLRKLK